jgi:carbonic anhydrase
MSKISYKLLGTREWFVIHHSNCGMGHSPAT